MDYIIHLIIIIAIYIPLALSLDLVVGHTGILSITHAAFYGLGAYATAILTKFYNYNFFTSMLMGMILSALIAIAISYSLKKVRGDYYSLASIGLAVIVYTLFMNLDSVTHGPFGIFGIARPSIPLSIFTENINTVSGFTKSYIFSSNISFLLLATFISMAITFLIYKIKGTHFIRVLHAIREDEQALSTFNYNVNNYKMAVFALAAAIASVSGSLYAAYISFIDPTSFTVNESIFLLTIIILGGLASMRGVIYGVIALTLLPEILRFIGLPNEIAAQTRVLLYGMALIYLMYKRPVGMLGKYSL